MTGEIRVAGGDRIRPGQYRYGGSNPASAVRGQI